DDLLDRILAVDQLEHGQLLAGQAAPPDLRHRILVAQKDHVEVVDLALDEVPLIDPPEAFHQDAVDRQPERGVDRHRGQVARGPEHEASEIPAQHLVDDLAGLARHDLLEIGLTDVAQLDELRTQQPPALLLARLEQKIEVLPGHQILLEHEAAQQKLLADPGRDGVLDLAAAKVDVDLLRARFARFTQLAALEPPASPNLDHARLRLHLQ